jgi:predicted AlkP superfamily pyrophosphatase or phosphodiesterase
MQFAAPHESHLQRAHDGQSTGIFGSVLVVSRSLRVICGSVAAIASLAGFSATTNGGARHYHRRELAHRVVLISLDGFRWDYLQRPAARRLRQLASHGAHAERLIPSFPTKTFPNHYTLVTGLYPEHHGIAANVMRDAVLGRFATGNDPAVRDARWFGGEPIWVTAETQGMRSAAYFWPGSEAAIGGVRPHWYFPFNVQTSRADRVEQILGWLTMPDSTAPHLIAAYFSDVDTEGHEYGPDSPQTDSAIAHVDSVVGAIVDGIVQLGDVDRVDIIVVSDHGMAEISSQRTIALDDYVSLDSFDVGDWSPVATLIPKPGRDAYVFNALAGANPHLQVFRKGDLPARLHYNTGARVTPIVAIADEGWSIGTHETLMRLKPDRAYGAHGYDNQLLSMGALFIAAGPDFRSGLTVPPFSNVHLYALLAHVLHLHPAVTDGSLDSVSALLR